MPGLGSLGGLAGSLLGGPLGGIGGSILGGFMGGDHHADDGMDLLMGTLFGFSPGQTGINGQMHRQIGETGNLYKKAAQAYGNFGKAGRTQINDWMSNQNANDQQSLAARGLGNSTLVNSMSQATGAQGTRLKQQLGEDVLGKQWGMRLAGNAATNSLWDTLRQYQIMPAQFAMGQQSGLNQASGDSAAGWAGLLTNLFQGSGGLSGILGGMGGGGGYRDPSPNGPWSPR